jgi:hypothetical protein
MTNFKFTGQNIASALLIIAFFMPWINITLLTMSGYALTTTAISPGLLAGAFDGGTRLLMLLIALVPLSGALILWQNMATEKKYLKYMKMAHTIPLIVLVIVITILVMKTRSLGQPDYSSMGNYGYKMPEIPSPSVFDILGFGVYLSLAAGAYLFMVNRGKIKDKEYFNQNTSAAAEPNPPVN